MPCALCLICGFAANNVHASIIVQTPRVSTRVEPQRIFNQRCRDEFFGCMDQFCNLGNESGGSCLCSNDHKTQTDRITRLAPINAEAERLRTIEVERIRAGAAADIIFTGGRRYDAHGNVIAGGLEQERVQARRDRRQEFMNLLTTDFISHTDGDVSALTGDALQMAVRDMCRGRMPPQCANDMELLVQLYGTQVRNDCRGFALAVDALQREADQGLTDAHTEIRMARVELHGEQNRFNRGQCVIAFRECMQGPQVCGGDWRECAQFAAADAMATPAGRTQPRRTGGNAHQQRLVISVQTLERLNARRHFCESVLDQCIAVRNFVWDDFLVDIAPDIHLAELRIESDMRQSCMERISECIMGRACHDRMGPDGNIDACLDGDGARVARATCRVEIDPCERMEPDIWQYVVARLRAIGNDRCVEEVNACFTRPFPFGCGDNFAACAGVDLEFMQNMCPLTSLPICARTFRGRGRPFTMQDLDQLLMGLYLNIDNAALENCQAVIDDRMMLVCGSLTDCNTFAAPDFNEFGTGSLRSQKSGDIYRVLGMISFGQIRIGNTETMAAADGARGAQRDNNRRLAPGEIGVEDYIERLREMHRGPNDRQIIGIIEAELHTIATTINRTIDMIASDPHIQNCIGGRNLGQITGEQRQMTARFPNLLNNTKMIIANSALRQAQINYSRRFNELVVDATREASTDVAEYMCRMMASTAVGGAAGPNTPTALAVPYAIMYEVARGLTRNQLLQGGSGKFETRHGGRGAGIDRTVEAFFNRADRTCCLNTTTITITAEHRRRSGFWGIGARSSTNVTHSDPSEKRECFQM